MLSILKYFELFFYLRRGGGLERGSGGEGREREREGTEREGGGREGWKYGGMEREGLMERVVSIEREG
jgi:hypothetical protein